MKWNLPGWIFSIKEDTKITHLMIQVKSLREAASILNKMNPSYRVIGIHKHYGATA